MIRRTLAAAALAAAVVVLAQSSSDPTPKVVSAQSAAVLNIPGSTVGAAFESTPGTVFNWSASDGVALKVPAGQSLTMVGTVPVATTTTAFPYGFGAGRRGVGPYSATNYFTRSTLGLNGNATICIAFTPTSDVTTGQIVVQDIGALAGGWYFWVLNGNLIFAHDGSTALTTPVTAGALNIACGGAASGTAYYKLNGATTLSEAGALAPSQGDFIVGQYFPHTNAFLGTVHEVWVTTTPWSGSSVAAIEAAAMANGDARSSLFPDDANTVLHLRGDAYDGTTWKSPRGALTTVGTVPYSDAWAQPVAGARQATGAGPFTNANYYTFGTGGGVLDFAGDFSACFVTMDPGTTAIGMLISQVNWPASGYFFRKNTPTGVLNLETDDGASHPVSTANAFLPGLNVGCVGRAGATGYAKLNGGAIASGVATSVRAPSVATRIGQYGGGAQGYDGNIIALWASTQTPTDALFTAQIARALGQTDANGNPLTVTRSTTETYEIPSQAASVYTVPAGIAAVGPSGVQVWRQSTNMLPYSADLTGAAWANSGVTFTAGAAVAPDGTTTASRVTVDVSLARHYIGQATSGLVIGSVNTASAYVKAGTASKIGLLPNNAAAQYNWTSVFIAGFDLSTGTVLNGFGYSAPQATIKPVGNGWYRVAVTGGPAPYTVGGYAVAILEQANPTSTAYTGNGTDSIYFWSGQDERQIDHATPYVPTVAAAVQRNADAISASAPLLPGDQSWCVSGTYTPGSWLWNNSTRHGLWSMGTEGQASSAWAALQSGVLTFGVKSASWQDGLVTFDVASTGALTTSEPHAVKACVINNSRVALYWDGRPVAAASNGGDLSWAPPGTIRLGALSTAGNEFDGGIRDFKVERAVFTPTEIVALDAVMLGSYQFAATGQTIPENILGDASKVVSHVVWNGTSLVDTKGVAWTMVGAVPQVTAGPWYPQGFTSMVKAGAGPFTAVNYYSKTGGSFSFNLSSGVIACVVYDMRAITGTSEDVLGNYDATVGAGGGWWISVDSGIGPLLGTRTATGGNTFLATVDRSVVGLNVICAGTGAGDGSRWIKLNLAAAKTDVPSAWAECSAGLSCLSTIGVLGAGAEPAANTSIREVILFAGEAFTDAKVTKIQRHVFGLTGNAGPSGQQAVTTTRTTTKTCDLPDEGQGIYTMPAGVACINKKGVQAELQQSNIALQSEAFATTPWGTNGTCTTTVNTATLPAYTSATMETVLCTGSVKDAVYQPVTVASSTGPWTISAYLRSTAGTAYESLVMDLGAGSAAACSCSRSDGIACTPYSDVLGTPVNATFTTGVGTLATGTYYYRVSAVNRAGQENPASPETSLAVVGPVGINVNWSAVPGALSYKVYGRTTGAEQLMATVAAPTLTWLDNGSVTPAGGMVSAGTSGTAFVPAMVGTTPVRVTLTCSSNVATTSLTAGVHDGFYSSTSNVGGIFGAMQLETGAYATSYVPTTTVAVQRNADDVVVTNVWATSNLSTLGFGFTVTPEYGASWTALGSPGFFSNYPYSANNNFAFIGSAGSVAAYVGDAAAGQRVVTSAVDMTAGGHSLFSGVSGGNLSLIRDGIDLQRSTTGVGTGIITTTPSTWRIGCRSPNEYSAGYLRNIRFCTAADYRSCY